MKIGRKRARAKRVVEKKLALQRVPGKNRTGDPLLDLSPPLGVDPLENANYRTLLRQRGAALEKRDGKWIIISPPRQPAESS